MSHFWMSIYFINSSIALISQEESMGVKSLDIKIKRNLGSNPTSTSQLCDLGQVTFPLRASASSFGKWD